MAGTFGLATEYKFLEGSVTWLICVIEPVIILVMVVLMNVPASQGIGSSVVYESCCMSTLG